MSDEEIQAMVIQDLVDKFPIPVRGGDATDHWLEHVYRQTLDTALYLRAEIERRKGET